MAVILLCEEAGLGLDTIRMLSATAGRASRQEILRTEAEALGSRIAAARAALEFIEGGLGRAHEDVTRCPNYRRLVAERMSSGARTLPSPAPEQVVGHAARAGDDLQVEAVEEFVGGLPDAEAGAELHR